MSTHSAVHRAADYPDLPPLPPGFVWTYLEANEPVSAIELVELAEGSS